MAALTDERRNLGFWFRAWIPVLIAVAVIAVESTPYFGADRTSKPLRWAFELLFGHVSDRMWPQIHHYIRKVGHFVGYGTMGVLWLRAWWMSLRRASFLADATLGLFCTAIVASADEFHQTFLPNRTGVPTDVVIDCSGALVMQLIVYLIVRIRSPKPLAHAA